MDLAEGVGESSSPPRSFGSFGAGDLRNDVYIRLVEIGNQEAVSNPDFRDQLNAHFSRLPLSYGLDVNIERVEDVLLHMKLLALAKQPEMRPVYHVCFLENICASADANDGQQYPNILSTPMQCSTADGAGGLPLCNRDCQIDFEPCSKLEDLNLDVRKNSNYMERMENLSKRQEVSHIPIHEIIFSTMDKPKLLSQLSALLSDIGLNIREAHVFSTADGYSLDVFVVDGWPVEGHVVSPNVADFAMLWSGYSWFA